MALISDSRSRLKPLTTSWNPPATMSPTLTTGKPACFRMPITVPLARTARWGRRPEERSGVPDAWKRRQPAKRALVAMAL
jgi:hypothetical protein